MDAVRTAVKSFDSAVKSEFWPFVRRAFLAAADSFESAAVSTFQDGSRERNLISDPVTAPEPGSLKPVVMARGTMLLFLGNDPCYSLLSLTDDDWALLCRNAGWSLDWHRTYGKPPPSLQEVASSLVTTVGLVAKGLIAAGPQTADEVRTVREWQRGLRKSAEAYAALLREGSTRVLSQAEHQRHLADLDAARKEVNDKWKDRRFRLMTCRRTNLYSYSVVWFDVVFGSGSMYPQMFGCDTRWESLAASSGPLDTSKLDAGILSRKKAEKLSMSDSLGRLPLRRFTDIIRAMS